MRLIKLLGQEESTIVMVGTHAENCTNENIQNTNDMLKNKFPKHKYSAFFNSQIFPVSAKTGQGIRELKKNLLQIANETIISPVVPVSWVQLYEIIKLNVSEGTDFIYYPNYQSWALKCTIKEELALVTKHLNSSGILIYFDNEDLKDLVILNPQWLANIMACLITMKTNFVLNGFIEGKKLANIFSKYSENLLTIIVNLLQKFKIIYPIDGGRKYLVPSLLPAARPAREVAKLFPEKLPENYSSFGRVFHFGQLPLGLFSRLMVAILHTPSVTGKIFWGSGIIITISSSKFPFLV